MKIQECVFDKIEDAYNEFKMEMRRVPKNLIKNLLQE